MSRRYNTLTEAELDAAISECMENKESLCALAKKLDINHATIYNHAKKLGYKVRGSALNEGEMELIYRMEKEGKSIKEMAEAVGKSYNAMQSWLQYRGYRLSSRHFAKETDTNPLTAEEISLYGLTMATRKPQKYKVEYNGKVYYDVTEFFTGV